MTPTRQHLPNRGTRLAYSVEEFADAAGIGKTTAYGIINRGEIRVKKAGSRTLIPAAEAVRWLNDQPIAADGGIDGEAKS